MLDYADLRGKLIILLFASSGIRLGGMAELRVRDLKVIYDDSQLSKIIAFSIKVYRGTYAEYLTFGTPECWRVVQQYLALRTKYGEVIEPESPLLLARFDEESMRKAAKEGVKPLSIKTIPRIIKIVRDKAGVNLASQHYKNRFTIKAAHGFRKYWSTVLRNIRTNEGIPIVDFLSKERMMGHALLRQHKLEENYDRADFDKVLLKEYLKAVSELTISEEARLELDVKRLQKDVSTLKTVETELVQKDKEIQNNAGRISDLERTVASLQETIEELATLAGKNLEKSIQEKDLELQI
jgi:integrase